MQEDFAAHRPTGEPEHFAPMIDRLDKHRLARITLQRVAQQRQGTDHPVEQGRDLRVRERQVAAGDYAGQDLALLHHGAGGELITQKR